MKSTYLTTKTNVRLERSIVKLMRQQHPNVNGFAKDALSDLVRAIQLQPGRHGADLEYITHNSSGHPLLAKLYQTPEYDGTKHLQTLRLRTIDLNNLKLLKYDLSRTLRLALLYGLELPNPTDPTSQG